MKRLLTALTATGLLLWAGGPADEPSAFGAGDLDSPHPYGLSDDQKHILANKKAIEALQRQLLKQQQAIERNSERLDGLQSVVEGLNERVGETESGRKGRLDELNRRIDDLAANEEKNFEQIRKVLDELGALIDSINAKYVDRESFDRLEKAFMQLKRHYASGGRAAGDFTRQSKSKVFADAKRLFRKKSYDAAADRFAWLVKKRYKPATSSYYLGEIAYRKGRYKDAIAYYKKSASLYDKSAFMPNLLFHTAVSFQRLGKKEDAKEFYRSLIDLYPKSSAAKQARKNLARLK